MKNSDMLSLNRTYRFCRLPQPGVDTVGEILRGLRREQKTIDPKFFYDDHGSRLYEKITQTPEYYLTRAENEILGHYALPIAALVGRRTTIIEPGAGNCRKIEYLLEVVRPDVYAPLDVSYTTLTEACERLADTYPWLECIGIVADFHQIDSVKKLLSDGPRLAFFPGSTLGNMEPATARAFLHRMRNMIGPDGGILIGVDNVKDEKILHLAYNDSAGITAAFNKNVLQRLNRIVGADFVADNFEHRAFFNREYSRIEMHLVSGSDQIVRIAEETIFFAKNETIHTENSYKYTQASFCALAAEAGLQCVQTWSDRHNYFTLYYLTYAQTADFRYIDSETIDSHFTDSANTVKNKSAKSVALLSSRY